MVPEGPPDQQFLYLSDVLPTSWQAVEYTDIPRGGSGAVFGPGPIGQMCTRIAVHRDAWVFGIDSVINAVGMVAHGSPGAELAQKIATARTPRRTDDVERRLDRIAAFYSCIDAVPRGGTISLNGVYGGLADPMPMTTLFDKDVRIAMGQAHVRRWIDDVLPLVNDEADPLGVRDLATHRMPLHQAPQGYEQFQRKTDGTIKLLLETRSPGLRRLSREVVLPAMRTASQASRARGESMIF